MRKFSLMSLSPYDLLSEILSEHHYPFRSLARGYHYTYPFRVGSELVVRRWDPTEPWRRMSVWDLIKAIPQSSVSLVESELEPETGTVVAYSGANPPYPLVRSYSVIPHPERSYGEIINQFLGESIPPIQIIVGALERGTFRVQSIEEFCQYGSALVHQPLMYSLSDPNYSEYGCVVRVLFTLRLDYPTRLDLLWDPKLGGSNPAPLVHSNRVVLVRFLDEPSQSVLFHRYACSSESWHRRSVHLFADTIAMVSALLGYTTLSHSELAWLALGWWSLAVGNYVYHLSASACKESSVLLLSDMLNRVEDPHMLRSVLSRMMGGKDIGLSYYNTEMWVNGESRFCRVHRLHSLFPVGQKKVLKAWNLIRSQLGMSVIKKDNYLEVPHVYSTY